MEKMSILGVGVTNASKNNILEYVIEKIESDFSKFYIVTPNPEIIVFAHKNEAFKKILNNAEIALCDGVGLMLASRLLCKPIKERFTGVDFMYELCKRINEKPITVGFLGGRGRVAEQAAERLSRKYSGLKVAFSGSEWPENYNNYNNYNNYKFYNGYKRIDILFVAFGHPKQEQWISENLPKLPVKVAMAVGGSFDYISGSIPRAPKILRSLGLEWLFRLFIQPWRLKRQLALVEFVWLVLKEKFNF